MNILRLSAGKFKNKKLKVARETKPVMEKVKNAVFSIIDEKIKNADVLDLYAGSGNLGLESISRGANSCVFIEESYFATQIIEENIKNVITEKDLLSKLEVIKTDVVKHIVNEHRYYDVIFIDPPYAIPVKHILKFLHEILKKDGVAVYFHDRNLKFDIDQLNDKIKIDSSRNYGKTQVEFIKHISN